MVDELSVLADIRLNFKNKPSNTIIKRYANYYYKNKKSSIIVLNTNGCPLSEEDYDTYCEHAP